METVRTDGQKLLVALFEQGADGTRVLGRTGDPAIVELVRDSLVGEQLSSLARLKRPAELNGNPGDDPEAA